jgi:hypothetical protein
MEGKTRNMRTLQDVLRVLVRTTWFFSRGNFLKRRKKMKRWIVMMLVLGLVFVGCSRPAEESAPPEAEKAAVEVEKSAVEKEAVETAKEALPEETAQAEEADPDVANCLQLVSQAKFADALPVCLAALKKHPDNDQVKEAVESAQAGVGDAAAAATDAAQGAQEAAGEKAEGAMGEATGGLAP